MDDECTRGPKRLTRVPNRFRLVGEQSRLPVQKTAYKLYTATCREHNDNAKQNKRIKISLKSCNDTDDTAA